MQGVTDSLHFLSLVRMVLGAWRRLFCSFLVVVTSVADLAFCKLDDDDDDAT